MAFPGLSKWKPYPSQVDPEKNEEAKRLSETLQLQTPEIAFWVLRHDSPGYIRMHPKL